MEDQNYSLICHVIIQCSTIGNGRRVPMWTLHVYLSCFTVHGCSVFCPFPTTQWTVTTLSDHSCFVIWLWLRHFPSLPALQSICTLSDRSYIAVGNCYIFWSSCFALAVNDVYTFWPFLSCSKQLLYFLIFPVLQWIIEIFPTIKTQPTWPQTARHCPLFCLTVKPQTTQ